MQRPWGRNVILMELPALVKGGGTVWGINSCQLVDLRGERNFSSVDFVFLSNGHGKMS